MLLVTIPTYETDEKGKKKEKEVLIDGLDALKDLED